MEDRILITGAGILCPIGLGKDEVCRRLVAGRGGIGPVRFLDTVHRNYPCGEVPFSDGQMKEMLSVPEGKTVPRTALMGALALREALEDAGLGRDMLPRVAFVSGTTVGGMDVTEKHYPEYLAGTGPVGDIPLHDCRSCSELTASFAGSFGMITTVSTACSSAANAIILGRNLIRAGLFDVVVAGGSESLTRYHFNGFRSLMILDERPCRPFDATRAGLNLGEGAAYLVLERESAARQRGAGACAVLSGCGNACDAYHQTASSPDGEGAFRAMKAALEEAGLEPSAISYINAHGTGTPNNDVSESAAMHRLFGEDLPPVSSTKSFTGHTTSASGSIESVICLLAMEKGFLPVNLGWTTPFEGGVIPVTPGTPGRELRHVLCNAFAFGGNDSSLLYSKL